MFVRDVDPNEDYTCEVCGEPVLLRWLYCSEACELRGEA
jgi:predicted nucleic acid-binding Zn ribbon protein